MGFLSRGSFAQKFHHIRPTTLLKTGKNRRGSIPKVEAAGDLLEGTGIWDSETDWTLLEAPFVVQGGGLDMDPHSGSGVKVARWKPSVSPFTDSTSYTTTATWLTAAAVGAGQQHAIHQGTSVLITHTSGAQDYAVTSGSATTSYVLEIRGNVGNWDVGILHLAVAEA